MRPQLRVRQPEVFAVAVLKEHPAPKCRVEAVEVPRVYREPTFVLLA